MKKKEQIDINVGYTKKIEDKDKTIIIFVYNADSGLLNTLTDYTHKIVKPSTYGCNLCAVTYGNLGIKSVWKNFISELDYPVEFLHRDEFNKKFQLKGMKYPVAFLKKGDKISIFITKEEINNCKTLKNLIDLVTKKVKKIY